MLGYLSTVIICSEKRTVFRERSSRKTVSFEEQILSKDKYPNIFSKSNRGYCVYYPSNIFRNMRSLESWGICSDSCPWTLSFLKGHSFPQATLSENCSLLGTDNVLRQIPWHIFEPNGGHCLFRAVFNLVSFSRDQSNQARQLERTQTLQ